jgi:glycosyltransferase involved in cell wall biosynthesis
VRLIDDCRCIPAVKRNVGLAAATGDFVLFMNDDVWAEPSLLREHAATHASHSEPVAVIGRVNQSAEMPQTTFLEWYTPFAYDLVEDRADQQVPYSFCWSMNLSLPRDVMIAEGITFFEGWSEIGHEDVELGYRWTAAGHPIIYNPRALCQHYHLHSLGSACRLQASIGRGLHDLERRVPDPGIKERYGVFSWQNRPRTVARQLIRQILVNDFTGPWLEAWLSAQPRNTALTRWLYWKVMLRHTQRGYREKAPAARAAVARELVASGAK